MPRLPVACPTRNFFRLNDLCRPRPQAHVGRECANRTRGGFNRSSQHLTTEVYGKATWVDGDADGPACNAIGRSAAGAARCGAGFTLNERPEAHS